MARIIRCDMCGKEEDILKPTPNDTPDIRIQGCALVIGPYDLCPDCREKALAFEKKAHEKMLNEVREFLAIKGGEFTGNVHLCLSYLMLEPIKEKLSSTYRSGNDTEHAWQVQLKELLKETPVNVIAELGKTRHTIRELLELEVDHVLRLTTGPKDPVVLTIDGVPKFRGLPGVIKGNRAVEITNQIRPNSCYHPKNNEVNGSGLLVLVNPRHTVKQNDESKDYRYDS